MLKAKKARDQGTSHMADCQAALELADKAKRLTKTGKKESEELLKGMAKKTNALKDLLAKKDKWGSLAKAKALLVDAAKDMKKNKGRSQRTQPAGQQDYQQSFQEVATNCLSSSSC